MSERLPKPKGTLITEDLFDALTRVEIVGLFGQSLKVERLNAKNHEFNLPEHLKAILDPGDPQKVVEGDQKTAGLDTYTRTYLVHVWVMPSQLNGEPIDETMDAIIADVVRALCADNGEVNPPTWTRNGLAQDTWADDPITEGPLPTSLGWIIHIPINVRYTTRERDPFLND